MHNPGVAVHVASDTHTSAYTMTTYSTATTRVQPRPRRLPQACSEEKPGQSQLLQALPELPLITFLYRPVVRVFVLLLVLLYPVSASLPEIMFTLLHYSSSVATLNSTHRNEQNERIIIFLAVYCCEQWRGKWRKWIRQTEKWGLPKDPQTLNDIQCGFVKLVEGREHCRFSDHMNSFVMLFL